MNAASSHPTRPDFGHPPKSIEFWRRLVCEALSLSSATPFFVFSPVPIAAQLGRLDDALGTAGFRILPGGPGRGPSIRHWLSIKTQPVAPLLRWWRAEGRPVEVVSEFELRAALAEGFTPDRILVNGPAKHHWLASFPLRGLAVNFDSPAELASLSASAKKLLWRCGVRINTGAEFDPENPRFPTQFGFTADEAVAALKRLARAGIGAETVHFHLRTNIASAQVYEQAIAEVAGVCRAARLAPQILDIGGGIPVGNVLTRGGRVFDGEFGLRAFAQMLRQSVKQFPGLRELWLENGRWISAGSGVLVVKILDVKQRRGIRQLICDGGRTLNALPSLWEQHAVLPFPRRSGPEIMTAVHGPTCMAFDQLARMPLPRTLRAGDCLAWLDAGAYHIPWETRFSHGHAAVWWHDGSRLLPARKRQGFHDFWGPWLPVSGPEPR